MELLQELLKDDRFDVCVLVSAIGSPSGSYRLKRLDGGGFGVCLHIPGRNTTITKISSVDEFFEIFKKQTKERIQQCQKWLGE